MFGWLKKGKNRQGGAGAEGEAAAGGFDRLDEPAAAGSQAHLAQLRAAAEGRDVVEPPDASLDQKRSPLQGPGMQTGGRSWERLRPLEAGTPPPPQVQISSRVQARLGTCCRVGGLGRRGLGVFLARR